VSSAEEYADNVLALVETVLAEAAPAAARRTGPA
jgi:hypothetical protein